MCGLNNQCKSAISKRSHKLYTLYKRITKTSPEITQVNVNDNYPPLVMLNLK